MKWNDQLSWITCVTIYLTPFLVSEFHFKFYIATYIYKNTNLRVKEKSFNRYDYFLSSIMSSTTCHKYKREIATAFPNILQQATYMYQWNSKFSISLDWNCNYINFINLINTEFYINVFRVYLIDTIVTHNAKQSNLLLFSLKQHNVYSA